MGQALDVKTFRLNLKGRTIDVKKAQADSRLKGVDVGKADLNADGQISTETEVTTLFNEINRVDKTLQVRTADGGQTKLAAVVQAIGDLAGVNILREMARDDILLIGLNPSATREADALKKNGNGVIFVSDTDDKITASGTTYDLTNPAEVKAFVATLGLSAAAERDVADAINNAGTDARDEAAKIAWVWSAGERGGGVPARLIISGHSVGDIYWGDNNGTLQRDTVGALAKAMPKAAAQVEDLHLAACYCGGQRDLEAWLLIFPSVNTMWAYNGSAPGTDSGAIAHLLLWDLASRGDKKTLDRLVAEKTRKGENVAVWSRLHGYVSGKRAEPLSDLRSRVTAADPTFDQYFKGDKTVSNTQVGELRSYYNDVQAMIQHPDLPAADRPALERKRDVTIRLIYFDKSIKGKFAGNHAALIDSGYRSLGLTPPNFATLSRKDILKAIDTYGTAVKAAASPSADALRLRTELENGLRDLQTKNVPESWIE
jgi:hypothetical protein